MAVVKADGFGHGAVDVARTALAHGASWLGVTSLDEAFALREAGLRAPVLSWLNAPGADFHEARRQDVDVAVPSQAHLRAVSGAGLAAGVALRVHLHLDVGMARDGAAPSEWRRLCRLAREAERSGAVRVVGLMGHLGNADTPDDPANAGGRARFAWGLATARAAGLRPPLRHLAATAATLTDRASLHTLSRVGAGLVGIDPSGTTRLSPALTLTAPVVGVRRVAAGTPVGYGGSWRASRATTLALLPLGYADGVPRVTSGRAEVLLRGRRRPLVGRVSMDQVVVDLGDDTGRPRRGGHPLRTRPRRRADRRRVGGVGRHHRARDRHRHRRPGPAGDARSMTRTRVAVVGGGQSCEHEVSLASAAVGRRGARPGGVRRGAADHRAATAAGPARRSAGVSPTPSACSRAATWSCRRCTGRAARTAPWPRCATWPASRTSGRASAPERWPWTSGPPSSSREPWASPPHPDSC